MVQGLLFLCPLPENIFLKTSCFPCAGEELDTLHPSRLRLLLHCQFPACLHHRRWTECQGKDTSHGGIGGRGGRSQSDWEGDSDERSCLPAVLPLLQQAGKVLPTEAHRASWGPPCPPASQNRLFSPVHLHRDGVGCGNFSLFVEPRTVPEELVLC